MNCDHELALCYPLLIVNYAFSGSTRFHTLRDTLEKYIVLHLKLVYDLLETHPFSFLPVMKQTLQLVCSICFAPETESLLFQRCAIYSLNVLKQVIFKKESEVNGFGFGLYSI